MNKMTTNETETPTGTQLITLDPERYVTAVFNPFRERLNKAKEEAAAVTTIDVTTGAGMKVAIGHRAAFRLIRIEVEKARKVRKEPILQIGKLLDTRAKEIESEITAEEDRFDSAIKAEETRKERERAEREAAEIARVSDIHMRIQALTNYPAQYVGKPSAEIPQQLADDGPPTWAEEFQPQALAAIERTNQTLKQLYAGAKAQEEAKAAEELRLQEERAELARLRAEQKERDRLAALQAEEDRKRIAEENRLRAEADAARLAKIEEEERAARARIAEEEAAARAIREQADRVARETREEDERQARAARAAQEAEEAAQRAAKQAQEDAERRERQEAADAAARVLEAEQARQQAERTRLEAERREIERTQAELMDGDQILRLFVSKYAKRREYRAVVNAINKYMAMPREK